MKRFQANAILMLGFPCVTDAVANVEQTWLFELKGGETQCCLIDISKPSRIYDGMHARWLKWLRGRPAALD